MDSLTGPTAEHAHVIRHRRVTLIADQHRGLQGDPKRFYVAATRGRSSLTVWLEQEPFGLPDKRLDKLHAGHPDAEAQKLFSKIYDHIENVVGRDHVFNLDDEPVPFQRLLSDVLGDHAPTAATILTEAAGLWREVTGVTGDSAADKWDTIDDLLGDPDFPESDFVNETLKNIRKHGIDLADNMPQKYAEQHPEAVTAPDAIQQYAGQDCDWLLKLGMKVVDGVVVQGVGREAVQISVPVLKAPGLQDFQGGAEPMIGAFVALVWAVYDVIAPTEARVDLRQVVHAHKAETREYRGLEWWSRTCNSDRAAFILYAPDLPKKTRRQLYAYLGGGSLTVASCDVVQSIVCRAKNKTIASAVLVTAALLALTSPDVHYINFRASLFLVNECATNEDELAAAALDEDEDDASPLQVDDPAQQLVGQCKTMQNILYRTLGLADMAQPDTATQKLQEWVSSLLVRAAPPAPALPTAQSVPARPAGRRWSTTSWGGGWHGGWQSTDRGGRWQSTARGWGGSASSADWWPSAQTWHGRADEDNLAMRHREEKHVLWFLIVC